MRGFICVNERVFIGAVFDENDKLIQATGFNVKAELIELNHVKITKNGHTAFLELAHDVVWLEPEGR